MDENFSGNINQDSKNLCILTWVLTIFFGFIPGLVIYFLKKDDAFVQDHAKESLNWSITNFIISVIGAVLIIVLIGFVILGIAYICNLIFCIIGAINGSNGKTYRTPFCIRFIS